MYIMSFIVIKNREKAHNTLIIKILKVAQILKETFIRALLRTGYRVVICVG